MDDPMTIADNYLLHVQKTIAEAAHEIEVAATTPRGSTPEVDVFGAALGAAQNALTRAKRDLAAHLKREEGRDDRTESKAYFRSLLAKENTGHEQLVIAILPLPLEYDRLSLITMKQRNFSNDFGLAVNRFNNAERRNRLRYLTEVPGSQTSTFHDERFRFTTRPQGGVADTEEGELYSSAAFVFKRRVFSHSSPRSLTVDWVTNYVDATLRFVWRLYEDLHIGLRAIGVQATVVGIADWDLSMQDSLRTTTQQRKDKHTALILPAAPLILRFPPNDADIVAATSRIDASLRSYFVAASD